MKRNNGVRKLPNSQINPNGNIDYEDFPEVVPFLEAVSNHNLGIYKAPKKRYRKSIFRVTIQLSLRIISISLNQKFCISISIIFQLELIFLITFHPEETQRLLRTCQAS